MDKKSEVGIIGDNVTAPKKFNLMFDPVGTDDKEKFIVEETPEGYNVRYITIDNEPESPRQCDNFGTMVCFHGKYSLGDEGHGYRVERFDSWDELRHEIESNENLGVILPLYIYDHSGITMRTSPFNDRWDSGQVGFIFVSEDKIREEFSIEDTGEDINEYVLHGAKEILEAEVEIYDHYLTGDVYRLVKEKFGKDGKQVDYDIAGGYYGVESAKEELKIFQVCVGTEEIKRRS